MACSLSLTGRQYPCAKAVGGLKKIYFAAYVEGGLTITSGAVDGVSVQLPVLDSATQDEIKLLAAARPHIVVEDYNGQQMVVGLEHGADLTGGTLATGANLGDYSGFTLTFEALEKNPPEFLTDAVTDSAASPITPAPTAAS